MAYHSFIFSRTFFPLSGTKLMLLLLYIRSFNVLK